MRQEKLADSCQHKLESDKKNPLKRRKHLAKTVRCFPLLSAFGSRFWSSAFAAWLVDIHTQFHIVKILLHHDSPRKHPMAHLFTIIRDLKRLHVQRPSAVLADCSINNRIILPLFHTAFDVSMPQTTGNSKSRRDAQDLRRYKQRKRVL